MNAKILRSLISFAWCGSLFAAGDSGAAPGDVRRLHSPDGRIQVSLHIPASGLDERMRWSAAFRGKPVLTECGLGLQTADAGDFVVGAKIVNERSRFVDERIPVLFGKSDHANDHFHETRFTLETPPRRRVDVVFRCYDDAIALRYELPVGESKGSAVITNEITSFRLTGEPAAFVQYLESTSACATACPSTR